MTQPKSILLHLDGSPSGKRRLLAANQAAEAFDAQVTALYAVMPWLALYPAALGTGTVGPIPSEIDLERRLRAKAVFDEAAAGRPRLHWEEWVALDAPREFARRALCADLLVLGQHGENDATQDVVPPDFVASVVVDSGCPALVVPYATDIQAIGRTVLVAWKPTREAARAVTAALPWLQRAARVHVAVGESAVDGNPPPGADLDRWLRAHGVNATLHQLGSPSNDVADPLLSMASDLDASLLVMGCYGHSRAREWLLGGTTRTLLKSMTVPVLMAH